MTISQAIERADAMVPNSYTHPEKIGWLAALDGRVRHELFDTHHGGASLPPEDNRPLDPSAPLLIPPPWDEAYIYHLAAMIDFADGETARYNENIAMFHTLYGAFADHYRRTHLPRGGGFRY